MAKVWLKIIWVTIAAFQWISNWLQEWNLNFSSIPSLWIHWILSFQVTAWFWLQLNDSWGKNLNSQISIIKSKKDTKNNSSVQFNGLCRFMARTYLVYGRQRRRSTAALATFSGLVVCAENLRTCSLLVPYRWTSHNLPS